MPHPTPHLLHTVCMLQSTDGQSTEQATHKLTCCPKLQPVLTERHIMSDTLDSFVMIHNNSNLQLEG